jgi:hypothetical protein
MADEWEDPVARHERMEQAHAKLAAIAAMRQEGAMQAAMSDEPHYTLIAHYSFPNGTTGDMVENANEMRAIARRMGLPDADDPMGFGIWYVPDLAGRKDWAR